MMLFLCGFSSSAPADLAVAEAAVGTSSAPPAGADAPPAAAAAGAGAPPVAAAAVGALGAGGAALSAAAVGAGAPPVAAAAAAGVEVGVMTDPPYVVAVHRCVGTSPPSVQQLLEEDLKLTGTPPIVSK